MERNKNRLQIQADGGSKSVDPHCEIIYKCSEKCLAFNSCIYLYLYLICGMSFQIS